jgi:hypothetical protein
MSVAMPALAHPKGLPDWQTVGFDLDLVPLGLGMLK